MTATTTDLAQDLHHALTASGLTPIRATRVVNLLPPAGQHWLLGQLREDPQNTFPTLVHKHLGEVADLLRTTHSDAITARKAFRTAVKR